MITHYDITFDQCYKEFRIRIGKHSAESLKNMNDIFSTKLGTKIARNMFTLLYVLENTVKPRFSNVSQFE